MDSASKASAHCVRGMSRHADGDLAGAVDEFGKAIAVQPDCAEAWNNRGAARHQMGDLVGAVADFDSALEISPRYAEALNNRGIVRHVLGDLAGALADFDRALEIRPRYAQALASRGTTRQAMGDVSGALADFDRAIGIHPDYAEAYLGRASALYVQGDCDGAIADYGQVLRLVPRHAAASVYHLRAGVRVSQKRFDDAVSDCNLAIEIDPRFCMAYISRGNARYHRRDLAAHADYRTAFEMNPRASAAEIIRILTVDVQEDREAVLENCRQHVRIDPDDVVAHARRGLTLLLLGSEAEAARDFEEIRRRTPDLEQLLTLLIHTARQQRNTRTPRSG